MGYNEFKELWAALNAWKQNFMMIDQDRSGTVELHELTQVIVAMGKRDCFQIYLAKVFDSQWAAWFETVIFLVHL